MKAHEGGAKRARSRFRGQKLVELTYHALDDDLGLHPVQPNPFSKELDGVVNELRKRLQTREPIQKVLFRFKAESPCQLMRRVDPASLVERNEVRLEREFFEALLVLPREEVIAHAVSGRKSAPIHSPKGRKDLLVVSVPALNGRQAEVRPPVIPPSVAQVRRADGLFLEVVLPSFLEELSEG